MTNPSTQLRALEGEIKALSELPVFTTLGNHWKVFTGQLLTIAKELETERDALALLCPSNGPQCGPTEAAHNAGVATGSRKASAAESVDHSTGIHPEYHRGRDHERMESEDELASLRTENATLKRRLDEAIGGLHVAHERLDRLPQQADMEDALWCAISCEEIEHTLTRITEIDKL